MTFEHRPRRPGKPGESPVGFQGVAEAPSLKLTDGRLERPIRLQPVDDVVMTPDGDQPTGARADGLSTAKLAALATVRSTTLVNSSITARSRRSAQGAGQLARNCSPFDRTANGRSQLGGLEKPTEELQRRVISWIGRSAGNASTSERSFGQSKPPTSAAPEQFPGQRRLAATRGADDQADLPILSSSSGSSTDQETLLDFVGGKSNSPSS